MADDQDPDLPAAAAVSDIAAGIVDKTLTPQNQPKIEKIISDSIVQAEKVVAAATWNFAGPPVRTALRALLGVIQAGEPALDDIAKIGVDAVLGVRQRRGAVPDNAGKLLLDRLAPAGGAVEPGLGPAANYLTSSIHLAIETWVLGLISELFVDAADVIRGSGATMHSIGELREVVDQVTGGGRITRRILAPFIDAGIVTPAKWATNKQYRPTLLTEGAAIEGYLRGDLDFPRLNEELGRQGLSAERIDVLVNNAQKRLSFADIAYRHWRGELSDVQAAIEARALGYDESTSFQLLAIDDLKRIDALHAPIVADAVSAFLAGDIPTAEMETWVNGAAPNQTDARRIIDAAHDRRAIRRQHITSAHMRALVLEGIAAVHDYVQALEREGYPPFEITLLELSLRKEQQADRDLEKAKAEKKKADEEKARRDAEEKKKRDDELAAKRARTFPALTEYRLAYVHGFVDRQAYVDALAREKIAADDAAFLLAGADADREQYLADQAAAEQKKADHAITGLSIATLEQAVLKGILSVAEFDSTLAKEHIPDGDRRLYVRLLQAALADQADAAKKRDEADRLAALRGSSIAEWEHAVRLGVRSRSQYAAFLSALGLTEPARALILDVLDAQLAADDAAKKVRIAREAAAAANGISLAQRRRAVIAGVRPRAYYEQALIDAGWPVDDQLAELDLVDVEIAARAAADAKAAAIAATFTPSIISVASLTVALSLGLITPAEFATALRARGASAADVDLLTSLAVAKVPDTRAAQQLHAAVDTALAAKSISLADLDQAVRRGLVTLDQYAADLAGRGYGVDDVALLRQLLQDKVGLDVDGLERKIEAALAKADGAPELGALVDAFDAGALTPATLQAQLEAFGAPRDAALVYVRLLTSAGVQG